MFSILGLGSRLEERRGANRLSIQVKQVKGTVRREEARDLVEEIGVHGHGRTQRAVCEEGQGNRGLVSVVGILSLG